MSLQRAHGHERKRATRGNVTAHEPITLEQFRREYQHEFTEVLCEDCIVGDHEACRRAGGYLDDENNDRRCGCHLSRHALDNR